MRLYEVTFLGGQGGETALHTPFSLRAVPWSRMRRRRSAAVLVPVPVMRAMAEAFNGPCLRRSAIFAWAACDRAMTSALDGLA
jgi:hypothetical protein